MRAERDRRIPDFLDGGGDLGRLMAAFDWRSTPLGPIGLWPQSLKTTVGLLLRSPVPIVLLWGVDGIMIYNDAYSRFAAGRHPRLLGSKVREGWPEVADFNDNVMRVGLSGGTLSYKDQELTLYRHGVPEQVWMNLDYSPVLDEAGRPAGVLAIVVETTERKRTEAALQASEARLRFLDELGKATQSLVDATNVMQATARLLGQHLRADVCAYADMASDQDAFVIRGDWTATGARSIVGSYSLDGFGEIAATRLRAGQPLVTRDVLRDLGPKQARGLLSLGLQATVCMPFVKDGRLTALMAIHSATPRDWTEAEIALIAETTERSWAHIERIHAEAALRASEARFEAIANSIDQLIWSTRPDGFHDYYNQRWYDYTGVPAGSTDGEGWSGMFHPDDQDRAWAVWRHSLDTGEPYHIEYRLRHASGQYRWVIGRAQCVRDAEGRIVRWYGTCTDIHDFKMADEALRDLNATLEQRVDEALAERKLWADIFETTDALIAVLAPDYRYLAVNEAYAREFEHAYGKRPAAGGNLLDLLAGLPEQRAAAKAIWDRALAGETFTVVEDPDDPGRDRPAYELRFGIVQDREGRVVGALQYAQDVTERLRDQAQLRQAEEALRQAQKMEAVGQLTGGVAHDFNNLLTIIRSSSDLLRRPDLPEERRRRYVDAIADTVDRAAKLTGQLLAFARRQALKPEVFDVPGRLHATTDMLRTVLGSRIEMRIEVDCDPCFVEADVVQFETALVNMAVNARDAMNGEGVLTLTVRSLGAMPAIRSHVGSSAQFVAVSIADTGAGIPDERLAQIFEPFFTTKEVGKGTGLGLSQVYGFAKQSGGDVAVASELGRGTTFTLYLPRVQPPAKAASDAQERALPEAGRGRRVLVVEDNVDVGQFSTQILQDLGYETTWAGNGSEALRVLGERGAGAFDVVFSDVVMPGMSGVELGREVRRRYPGLPVVLTSGYSHVLAEEGTHGFELIQKPYAAEELSRVLRRVSGGASTARGKAATG